MRAIGNAWTVKIVLPAKDRWTYAADTIGGSLYNYGGLFGDDEPPHYPVPAINECQWCASKYDVCNYNGDGVWCPSMCFGT